MAEIVLNLVFAVLAILGLAEIIHFFKMWLLKPANNGKRIMVLVPDDDFERQILSVYEQFKWQGEKFANKILVVDCLPEHREECKKITDELGIEFCEASKLMDKMF